MDQIASPSGTATLDHRFAVFLQAVLFVAGFSLVFIVGWGGAVTALGQLFGQYKSLVGQVGGVMVIVFGLSTLGIVRLPWLYYDTRPDWKSGHNSSLLSSALMGIFFAAGWTPCIGTTLGAILTLGFSQQTVGPAMVLSSGYAFGMGLPFLVIGLMMDRAANFVQRFRKYLRAVNIASGLFLIIIGLMMVTGRMTLIAIWAQRTGLYLDLPLGVVADPTYIIAFAAGLLSFISPCVLPLVPAYIGYLSGHAFRRITVDAGD